MLLNLVIMVLIHQIFIHKVNLIMVKTNYQMEMKIQEIHLILNLVKVMRLVKEKHMKYLQLAKYQNQ